MNLPDPPVFLLTRDEQLVSKLHPRFNHSLEFHVSTDCGDWHRLLAQIGPGVVLLDLRLPPDSVKPSTFLLSFPRHAFIGLGVPRTKAINAPETSGMYATEDLNRSPGELFELTNRAREYHKLSEECRWLRQRTQPRTEATNAVNGSSSALNDFSVKEFIRIVRCIDNVEALQERLLEELATTLQLTRAGIVLRNPREDCYTVRSGWMLLPGVRGVRFSADDPFVLWLERHAHRVSRDTLGLVRDGGEAKILERVLDRLGAELILPLRGRGGLLGWLFTGLSISGQPFQPEAADRLMLVTDLMAVSLESALLYQEVAMQKTLAESLLEALPAGIVHTDASGGIQWFSDAAARILELKPSPRTGSPLHILGPRFVELAADLPLEAHARKTRDWIHAVSKRPLRVTAVRLARDHIDFGILFTVQDRSLEVALVEKQARLDRNRFWNDLAASVSHEVRNPLVSIKTFAQLLPERYQDPEFRDEFSRVVNREIERLNEMLEQMNGFARPGELQPTLLNAKVLLEDCLRELRGDERLSGAAQTTLKFDDPETALRFTGDRRALSICFAHLLRNAVEAKRGAAHLEISLKELQNHAGKREVRIRIRDDGRGLPDVDADTLFSPLFTTKPKGLGLGLAIARRTITDHGGRIDIRPADRGALVEIFLPVDPLGDSP
ncbi:MAG: hypothetical protein JJU29_06650 [Verrucomicrobia bacterium]|nr:hypothetical protein [Verrucomicrobiota bacterium]MCH8511553.1 hypothetical protein [Kiritimatiellia bacterium]